MRSTDDGTDRDGAARDGAPYAESKAPPLRRHRRREQRQSEGSGQAAAHPLQDAGRDERVDGGGRRGHGRRDGEESQAGHEDPLPPQWVAEFRAGQEQDGVGERVGVDGPLQARQGRAQLRECSRSILSERQH